MLNKVNAVETFENREEKQKSYTPSIIIDADFNAITLNNTPIRCLVRFQE